MTNSNLWFMNNWDNIDVIIHCFHEDMDEISSVSCFSEMITHFGKSKDRPMCHTHMSGMNQVRDSWHLDFSVVFTL